MDLNKLKYLIGDTHREVLQRFPMKFSTDRLLQQGIKAHQAGQTQNADRLYRSILKKQPNHPDANHNLGMLTLSLDKPELSLPYFKRALEANPEQDQFWLSLTSALIKAGELDEARKTLQRGRDSGLKGEKLDQLASHEFRAAYFFCCMVFLRHPIDPTPIIAYGQWWGEILTQAKGTGGFGYDPLFFITSENSSAAELPADIKNKLSHRGQASQHLIKQLSASLVVNA